MHGLVHETGWDRAKRPRRTSAQNAASRPIAQVNQGASEQTETPETGVVWLITQRSQVQIMPPLLGNAGQSPVAGMAAGFLVVMAA